MDASFKESLNEYILDVVNEIDIHAETVLMKLGETENKDDIESINILRQKCISKCHDIEEYNLEIFPDRKKLKFLIFIKNSSMVINEKVKKVNFFNKLGYLVTFNQHFKYDTIRQLEKKLNENVEVVETKLHSFQELIQMKIFIGLIENNTSDLFIDLCDPSKNILKSIILSSSHFELDNCDLDFLPKFINLDLIESLSIYNNKMRYLPSRPLTYFKNISNLTIEGCDNLISISPYNFKGLDNLIELTIMNNGIERIYANAFNGLKNLKMLNLSENKIEKLDVCSFKGLENLETLYLEQNIFDKIKTNNFESLKKLQKLYLSINEIEELESGSFNGLENLKVLKMFMGSSKILAHTNAFAPLKNLEVLDIFDTNFSQIDLNFFNDLTNLKCINACRSNLFSFEINTNLQMLEAIDISEANLTKDQINSIRFDNLKLLICSFERVPKFGENLKNLKALKVKDVTCFERECFQNVTNLNFLNVEFKYAEAIDSINENTLKNFSNFKYLEISNNSASPSDKEYYDTKNYLFLSLFNAVDQIRLKTKFYNGYLRKKICVKECLSEDAYFNEFLNFDDNIKDALQF
ncbi:unnamed protein product [Brachionus calyciflorus]|uniref:Uncharacterized protein n=1 Tax=Brachionus calyciflorus TaxID=104777 RepID=A0A813WC00_9BILA|nr:unnamed protein product [Brachionus calyciflorus]